MIQRCDNPKNRRYSRYGARGIKVCAEWYDFANFVADMGKRPSLAHSIERRDNDGPYDKNNCYWATKHEQNCNKCNNRYVEYRGEMMALQAAINLANAGLSPGAVRGRLARGWQLAEAIETPPRNIGQPYHH